MLVKIILIKIIEFNYLYYIFYKGIVQVRMELIF